MKKNEPKDGTHPRACITPTPGAMCSHPLRAMCSPFRAMCSPHSTYLSHVLPPCPHRRVGVGAGLNTSAMEQWNSWIRNNNAFLCNLRPASHRLWLQEFVNHFNSMKKGRQAPASRAHPLSSHVLTSSSHVLTPPEPCAHHLEPCAHVFEPCAHPHPATGSSDRGRRLMLQSGTERPARTMASAASSTKSTNTG